MTCFSVKYLGSPGYKQQSRLTTTHSLRIFKYIFYDGKMLACMLRWDTYKFCLLKHLGQKIPDKKNKWTSSLKSASVKNYRKLNLQVDSASKVFDMT